MLEIVITIIISLGLSGALWVVLKTNKIRKKRMVLRKIIK
jgi:hypothetical protein